MQFITAIIAAFAATASAAAIGERQAPLVCAGSTQPQCCAVSVLGLADLDCSTRTIRLCNTQVYSDVADSLHSTRATDRPRLLHGFLRRYRPHRSVSVIYPLAWDRSTDSATGVAPCLSLTRPLSARTRKGVTLVRRTL